MKKFITTTFFFLSTLGVQAMAQNFTCYDVKHPDKIYLKATLQGEGENSRIANIVVYENDLMLTMKKESHVRPMDLKPYYAFKNSINFNHVWGRSEKTCWGRIFGQEKPYRDPYLDGPGIVYFMTDGVEFYGGGAIIHNTEFNVNKYEFENERTFRATFWAIKNANLMCRKKID